MRAKLSLPFFLLSVVLLAAEDFESYPTAEAMRQVWQEFDAGNPPPERVEIGTLHGKALHVTAKRDYSLLCREMRNLRGAEAAGLTLTLRGDAANPKDAVMTVILRTEKNGAELGRKVVPLCSAAAQSVTIPARALGGRERFTLLLMFNKTGGTLNATVDEIEIAAAKREKIDGFDRAGDSAGLRREWPEFDAGNPPPDQQQLVTVNGKPAMRCITGSRTYAVLKRRVTPSAPGAAGMAIRLAGAPGNAKSGVIVFGARRKEGEANFAQMQIVPPEKSAEFVLQSPEFANLDSFLIVLSFHKTAGKFDVDIEEVALESLR